MPCTSTVQPNQTLQARISQVESALKRLERHLATGVVRLTIGPTGSVAFAGWKDSDGVTDLCGYRALSAQGSSALRMAQLRAESMQGRKVNLQAVAAGVHSHDGGRSWGSDK